MPLSVLIGAWDEAHRELAIALDEFPDEDLWKRPHPRLLSVGEIAGHVAYWQAVWSLGGGEDRPDLGRLAIKSPLVDHAFRYFTTQIEHPITLQMTPVEVLSEVERIHAAAREAVAGKEIDDEFPGQWGTWGNLVQYQAFHVAYHTGQVYSARHLLGHVTEDN